MSVAAILTPAISGILSRSEDPTSVIGGYSLSLSIIMLISLPHLRIQQLTIVYADSKNSLKILRKFLFYLLIIILGISILITAPPVKNFIFSSIFTVSGDLKLQAYNSIIWLVPLPCLLIIKMHLYGLALKFSKPSIIWTGIVFGISSILILCFSLMIYTKINGASVGSISMSIGTLIEIIIIYLILPKNSTSNLNNQSTVSISKITKFFLPLCFAALLPSLTLPIINFGLSRSENPEISISAVSIGFGLFCVVAMATNGVQNTVITFLSKGIKFVYIRNISLIVGLVTLTLTIAFILLNPVNSLILNKLMGLDNSLTEETLKAFKILAFLPPILVIEQCYSAFLMYKKNTLPILYVNLWRLAILLSWILYFTLFTNFSGTFIGAGAWAITLSSEALITWIYSKRYIKIIREIETF